MKEYTFHEIADIFPLMNKEEYQELKEDIKKNGYRKEEPIILFENKILDGRNRYNTCKELDIEPTFDLFKNGSPLIYVISKNLHRRHLNGAQKGDIGLALLPFYEIEAKKRQEQTQLIGKTEDNKPKFISSVRPSEVPTENKGKAIRKVAETLKTSENTIRVAQQVREMNDPEVNKKWESAKKGDTTIKAVQVAIQKKENKGKPLKPIPEDKYDVIYGDPPWFYEGGTTSNRIIENQYPTMETKDICKMKVPSNNDAILFLWCTNPKLEDGLQVIKAWGFIYKTNMVWVKDKIGMGYYARGRHELLLIATKGSPKVPEPENRPDSVIEAPRTEHSKKPEIVYELIEKMYPNRKYLELFARNIRDKWKSWGNEI